MGREPEKMTKRSSTYEKCSLTKDDYSDLGMPGYMK
jgi:hypothetical protein